MTPPSATPPDETPPRISTPRAEGIQRMVDATVALLRELPPEQITVRMVATRSGHHHRFVSEWFGGKSGLFRAALDALLSNASAVSPLLNPGADRIQPDVRISVHLMNWLISNDPEGLLESPPRHFRDLLTENFVEMLDIDPELADLLARRVIMVTVGMVLFGDLLDIDEETLIRLREIEVRTIQMLASDEP